MKNSAQRKKSHHNRGQGLIEYVILVALIALVSLAATRELGNKVKTKLKDIRQSIDSGIPVNGGSDGG